MPIKLQCKCGKTFDLPDHLVGGKIRCKVCGKLMKVPAKPESGNFETDPDDPLAVRGHHRCPDCGKSYPENIKICTGCGVNLVTGAQLYASLEASRGELRVPPPTKPGLVPRLLRLLGLRK